MAEDVEGRPEERPLERGPESVTPVDDAAGSPGLRSTLKKACAESGSSMAKLTVLATQNDPFRVDTPARNRDGEWLATQAKELGLGDRVIHLRGLHYMLASGEVVKPDGTPYLNDDDAWHWLGNDAAKAARWLGYIPFEQIKDARSSEPVIRLSVTEPPMPYLSVGVEVEIPEAWELEPTVGVDGFEAKQPFRIVLFGEKTSLEDVLAPIAERRQADLYLPAGEISDTFLHTMAKTGAEDGRPMVVLTFADCDPAGWQMSISIGRKLQALKATLFPELEFRVYRVALTPDHVREYRLPITPLKETEKRADRWTQEMGVEQTEIDALAALQPHLLDELARNAVDTFYDETLDLRVFEARSDWLAWAQARLDEQLDQEYLDQIQAEASAKLDELRDEIDRLNDSLQIGIDNIDLPEIVIPAPEMNGKSNGTPLLDSAWSWVEQTKSLRASKEYRR
jgi:hypothetical protein